MSIDRRLLDFATLCERRFGRDRAHCNEEGAYVMLADATIHIRLDDGADRITFWTELETAGMNNADVLAQVVMDYTAEHYLESGFAMGFNRPTGLVTLGRSLDMGALRDEEAFETIDALAREASAGRAWIVSAHSDARP